MRETKEFDTGAWNTYPCIQESNSFITVIIIRHAPSIDDKEAVRQAKELLGVINE